MKVYFCFIEKALWLGYYLSKNTLTYRLELKMHRIIFYGFKQ